jgi:hypothetical protein
MSKDKANILRAWSFLYYTFIFFPIIVGIDKYFNYLVDWPIYLNANIPLFLHVTTKTMMYILGIAEILIGLLVFMRPKLGGYLVMALLAGISINLISMQSHHHEHYVQLMTHYDVALHDIALCICAYVFVLLSKELGIGDNNE